MTGIKCLRQTDQDPKNKVFSNCNPLPCAGGGGGAGWLLQAHQHSGGGGGAGGAAVHRLTNLSLKFLYYPVEHLSKKVTVYITQNTTLR